MQVKTKLTIKIYLSIFLMVLFLFPFELRAENWIFYSDVGGKGFYDKDSIKSVSDKTVTVWTKLLPTQDNIDMYREMTKEIKKLKKEGKYPFKIRQINDDELSYQKDLTELHCNSGTYKYLKIMFYNKSNEIIYSSDDEKKGPNDPRNEIRYSAPDTPGYKFYSEVCNYRFPKQVKATDWRFYASSDVDNGYYDNSSIQRVNKNIIRVWTKDIYNESGKTRAFSYLKSKDETPDNPDKLDHQLILLEIDCVNKKYRNSPVRIYDKQNNCLFSNSSPWEADSFSEWNENISELNYDKLENKVCSGDKTSDFKKNE